MNKEQKISEQLQDLYKKGMWGLSGIDKEENNKEIKLLIKELESLNQ